MKAVFDKVFSRRSRSPGRPGTASSVSSELTHDDIENYYLNVMTDCMRRMLVAPGSVEIRVQRTGGAAHGLAAYSGYIRILKWDAALTPLLLQNMAVIDARVRKVVEASVLLEHTHFDGLWFQASGNTPGAPASLVSAPAAR